MPGKKEKFLIDEDEQLQILQELLHLLAANKYAPSYNARILLLVIQVLEASDAQR